MLLSDAIKHFSIDGRERGARGRLAAALGLSSGAISQWGSVVPQGQAYKLESLTKGKLKVNPACYQKPSSA